MIGTTDTYSTDEAIKAQEEYCEQRKVPHFAPYSGRCYSCGKDIYSAPYGYTVEYAKNRLITGCPYCRASYVD